MADQRFVFRNNATGATLELHNVAAVDGFGVPPVDVTATPRGWRMDGERIQWVAYGSRVFTVQFDTIARTWQSAAAMRRAVVRFFADKGERDLVCTRYDGTVLTLRDVRLTGGDAHSLAQVPYIENALQFVAPVPYFERAISATSVPLETALYEFDDALGFEYTEGGVEFSSATNEIVLYNAGDVPADTLIWFKGAAVEPYIENKTTGQRVEVAQTLGTDDTLEVDSAAGRVDVVGAEGAKHNAFSFLSTSSDFIRLALGENVIEFGSAGGGGTITAGGVEYYASL
jgi:hypothetical protein